MKRIGTAASNAVAACIALVAAQAIEAGGGGLLDQKIPERSRRSGKAPAMWAAIINENGIEAIAPLGCASADHRRKRPWTIRSTSDLSPRR